MTELNDLTGLNFSANLIDSTDSTDLIDSTDSTGLIDSTDLIDSIHLTGLIESTDSTDVNDKLNQFNGFLIVNQFIIITKINMLNLIDDVLILILKYLNLNERTELRLVSKKWKFFIDKIPVKKLVIFCNLPCTPGRLKLKHERFCLGDTIMIKNWNKFISNDYVQRCFLKSVEKLVIQNSDKQKLHFYYQTFDKLIYLELHDVRIDEKSKFLESNKIETLFLYYRDNLDYFRRDLDDLDKMDKKFGFLKLLTRLKRLKHLNIRVSVIDYI